MVKEYLSQKGVPFTEKDVSHDRAGAEEMIRKSGQMGVPVIDVDGEIVVGFNEQRLKGILSKESGKGAEKAGLGVSVADAAVVGRNRGVPMESGAYVGRVTPGSPGEKAGIKEGDVITEINGRQVRNAADLEQALSSLGPGSHIKLTLEKDSQRRAVEVAV